MRDRRAHAVLFGFDFQVNAAIVLMLENIRELKSLRLEGNEEDIELTLEDNRNILAQAKSVENASSDFSNVRANLKKTLITLSEGVQKAETKQLIFITNSQIHSMTRILEHLLGTYTQTIFNRASACPRDSQGLTLDVVDLPPHQMDHRGSDTLHFATVPVLNRETW